MATADVDSCYTIISSQCSTSAAPKSVDNSISTSVVGSQLGRTGAPHHTVPNAYAGLHSGLCVRHAATDYYTLLSHYDRFFLLCLGQYGIMYVNTVYRVSLYGSIYLITG